MRGTIAKRIRHEIYKEQSLRGIRKYSILHNGQVVNIDLRQQYLDAKRDYAEKR